MTEQENNKRIAEQNKIIFDFMGCIHSKHEAIDAWEMAALTYHKSWDALIPVCQKIYMDTDLRLNKEYFNVTNMRVIDPIEFVYEAVCEFLNQYERI